MEMLLLFVFVVGVLAAGAWLLIETFIGRIGEDDE